MDTEETPLKRVLRIVYDGRVNALAADVGVSASTVSCWHRADRRPPGAAGTIPARYHAAVLAAARARGRAISPGDLVAGG